MTSPICRVCGEGKDSLNHVMDISTRPTHPFDPMPETIAKSKIIGDAMPNYYDQRCNICKQQFRLETLHPAQNVAYCEHNKNVADEVMERVEIKLKERTPDEVLVYFSTKIIEKDAEIKSLKEKLEKAKMGFIKISALMVYDNSVNEAPAIAMNSLMEISK